MNTIMPPALPTGILLPETLLHSNFFAVLTLFVAINTLIYVALAVAKILPKIYMSDWIQRRRTRSETRSIYPEGEG